MISTKIISQKDLSSAAMAYFKYRMALWGHVHREIRRDVGGIVFESVGTIILRDAYVF